MGDTPITLTADFGLSFYIAIAIVVAVNVVKAFFVWWHFGKSKGMWTNKIPGWAWGVWAGVFAIGACLVLKVDVLSKVFASASFAIGPPWSYIASGFIIGISSNVMYKVVTPIAHKLKNAQGIVVCAPPGTPDAVVVPVQVVLPEDTPVTPVVIQEVVPDAMKPTPEESSVVPVLQNKVSAKLLVPWVPLLDDGPSYLVLEPTDGQMQLVEVSKVEWKMEDKG